jgi:hypothetical protein
VGLHRVGAEPAAIEAPSSLIGTGPNNAVMRDETKVYPAARLVRRARGDDVVLAAGRPPAARREVIAW